MCSLGEVLVTWNDDATRIASLTAFEKVLAKWKPDSGSHLSVFSMLVGIRLMGPETMVINGIMRPLLYSRK